MKIDAKMVMTVRAGADLVLVNEREDLLYQTSREKGSRGEN
jgi:hypothetical protein